MAQRKRMKMVFFSSDRPEVQRLGQQLAEAGIPCEIRLGAGRNGVSRLFREAELWVKRDRDCSRAFLFCVTAGLGFARPKQPPPETEAWNRLIPA